MTITGPATIFVCLLSWLSYAFAGDKLAVGEYQTFEEPPTDISLEYLGGVPILIMKQVAEIAFNASAERRKGLSITICDKLWTGMSTEQEILNIAQVAMICEEDTFARALAREWDFWWYQQFNRHPLDLRTIEERFLAYAEWRNSGPLAKIPAMHVFDHRLIKAYKGTAAFERKTVDPRNPAELPDTRNQLRARKVLLDYQNPLLSTDPMLRAENKNSRFLFLSETGICKKSKFGNSTLEILYEIAANGIACSAKFLAPVYSHQWEEWYGQKEDRPRFPGQTSSDRMFEYVVARIWGQISVDYETLAFEESLAAKYRAESSLPDLAINLPMNDEAMS